MTLLMMCRNTKNRKLSLGCFWTSINKNLLVLSLAVPRKSWDRHRVAEILLHIKLFRVLPVLGYLLGSFVSSGMVCTAQRFHTAEHDHTCLFGCPENLILSLITRSVPSCITSFCFSGNTLRYCHREQCSHDLITQVFLRSLQCGIVVLGFLDACVSAHHKHRLDSENSGNFGDCMKGRVQFMSLLPTPTRIKQRVLHNTSLASRTTPSGFPDPSPGIHAVPMIVPQHVKEAMIIMGGLFTQMEVLTLLMVKSLLDGLDFPTPPWANGCHVWSRRYHRGSSCFLWCENTVQQHC